MAEEQSNGQNPSMTLPISGIAAAIAIGLAVLFIYLRNQESGDGIEVGETRKPKGTKSLKRKLGLMTLITLIENDVSRKALVATLKAVSRRM